MRHPRLAPRTPWATGLLAVASLFVLSGCIHTPAATPKQLVDYAAAQVQQARHHYVEDYDPENLKLARAKISAGYRAVSDDKPDQAKAFAEEAELTVQLAELRAKAARAGANRKHTQRQIDALQNPGAETPIPTYATPAASSSTEATP